MSEGEERVNTEEESYGSFNQLANEPVRLSYSCSVSSNF